MIETESTRITRTVVNTCESAILLLWVCELQWNVRNLSKRTRIQGKRMGGSQLGISVIRKIERFFRFFTGMFL